MNTLVKEKKIINEDKEIIISKTKKRNELWDIVKGIGIISIVIGHTINFAKVQEFVYTYHLIIFFFVSIYFYNETKYGDEPFTYVGKRLKGMWPKYVFYGMIIVLLHNTFVKYHFYGSQFEMYNDLGQVLVPLLNVIVFKRTEQMAGAMWFIPTLLVTTGLFAGIIYFSRKIGKILTIRKKNEKTEKIIKYLSIVIFTIAFGIIGVFLNENKLSLEYHIHTSFLVIPICTLAYFVRKKADKIQKMKRWYIVIPVMVLSLISLIYVVNQGLEIELSKEQIINGYMFYIVSFIGICFCISLACIIEKILICNKLIELIGRHSFAIMALHFICVKGVDVLYAKIINETNVEVISHWVVAFPEKLWTLYILAGCLIPLVISIVIEKLKKIGVKNEGF